MTPAQIRLAVRNRKQALQRLNEEMSALQARCQHPDAVKIPKADTGNWSTSDDSYWFECECPDCGKRWVEDQ